MLTSAKFNADQHHGQQEEKNGIFTCTRPNCNICKSYLVPCDTFTMENGKQWEVKTHVTCRSKNVLYFQRCNFCTTVSNIGKTNDLRKRTNGHISSCRTGKGTDVFDKHVYQCNPCKRNNDNGNKEEGPYFKLWIIMEVDDYSKLLTYENYLHRCGYDTINRGKHE